MKIIYYLLRNILIQKRKDQRILPRFVFFRRPLHMPKLVFNVQQQVLLFLPKHAHLFLQGLIVHVRLRVGHQRVVQIGINKHVRVIPIWFDVLIRAVRFNVVGVRLLQRITPLTVRLKRQWIFVILHG